jgi:FkbM family methyltransferase
MIKRIILKSFFAFIKNKIDKPIIKKIRSLCIHITRLTYNSNYSPETNGEYRVLKIITGQFKKPVIFDVGANRGNYTNKALKLGSIVYAIEPVFEIFKSLKKLKELSPLSQNLFIFNKGFSNKNCTIKMNFASKNSEKSMIGNAKKIYHQKIKFKTVNVDLEKGDDFLKNINFLTYINLLKIDAEGHDFFVIEGFKKAVDTGLIDAIQFEYNKHNIANNKLLMNFYEALIDYNIGRIFPNHVDFKQYEFTDENFIDGNFLAVKKNNKKLYNLLRKTTT